MLYNKPMSKYESIANLTAEMEERIHANPLLNIDTFIIPSPFIKDSSAKKDMKHSFVWQEQGEILGYLLTYSSADNSEYLIYKLVTSPHGRGKGIGAAFLEHLADTISDKSRIYLYVWEKQYDTLEYFKNKGFDSEDSIVYRNRVYHRLTVQRETVLSRLAADEHKAPVADEIGRTRHDARKAVSLLMAMVNALAPETAGRIIEDINRETTTLVNMLNQYRDSITISQEVNLQDLILERLVPYVEASGKNIELVLTFSVQRPLVLGHWINIGRSLVNLASNAIDAMAENTGMRRLSISLSEGEDNQVLLKLTDNGSGMPKEMLVRDRDGMPSFVGKTTKAAGKGEGFGTVQVWGTFGSERLNVESVPGGGIEWTIKFERSVPSLTKRFASLQRRFHELHGLSEDLKITEESSRTDVIRAIWRLRQKEIFLFELLERFSRHHNIRDLFRIILSYWQNNIGADEMESRVSGWEGEDPSLNTWLSITVRRIKKRREVLEQTINFDDYKGPLFNSYAQSMEKVIIFTLNPADEKFLATDRKLAEHLDFVSYLGGNREVVLRGEFVGDVKIVSNPIYLGVWSIDSDEDLRVKLKLLQDGARAILNFDIPPEKKLAFYQSTYSRHSRDIDSDKSCTFGEFISFSQQELERRFVRESEDEMQGFLAALE